MKITCVLGPYFPVPTILGGAVERIFHDLCREFVRMGHDVTMISRRYEGLPDDEVSEGIRHIRLPSGNKPRSKIAYRFGDLGFALRAARALPPSDVTIINSLALPFIVPRARTRVIYVSVARPPKHQFTFFTRVDRLQAVSGAIADDIVRQSPNIARLVRVVPNPLAEAFVSRIVDERNPRDRTILFVGRITREKGLERLIRASGKLREAFPDWKTVIVGPHEVKLGGDGEGYLRELSTLADRTGANVTFTGGIYDMDRLMDTYRSAELFVYPTIGGDAFGCAPLEAMSAGCVPVVSNFACFREYLEPGENGEVFGTAEEGLEPLEAVLTRLMLQPERRAALGRRGIATARGYSPDRIARRFVDDFEELLENRPLLAQPDNHHAHDR